MQIKKPIALFGPWRNSLPPSGNSLCRRVEQFRDVSVGETCLVANGIQARGDSTSDVVPLNSHQLTTCGLTAGVGGTLLRR